MWLLGLVFGLWAAGCNNPKGGGNGADAGAIAPDAGVVVDGGGGGGDAGGDVARCKAASAALAAACPSDTQRSCQGMAYGSFCNADARPGLFADALQCLVDNSDAGGCRTFSDPSSAAGCVTNVYASTSSSDVDAIVNRVNTLCPGTTIMPQQTEPPLYALTPTQLATLKSCLDAASDCTGTMTCATMVQGPIAACYN